MSTQPQTEVDERFSDPGTTATAWAEAREQLEQAQLSWITTVRADGRPHVTPLVAVCLDDALHFATGATEQKALNLATNPHVILTTGCNRWDEGLDVIVEGNAVRVTDDDLLRRPADEWANKWDSRWRIEARDGVFRYQGKGEALVFDRPHPRSRGGASSGRISCARCGQRGRWFRRWRRE